MTNPMSNKSKIIEQNKKSCAEIENVTTRKFVRVKRTQNSIRKKTKKVFIDSNFDDAVASDMSKKLKSGVLIAHTLSMVKVNDIKTFIGSNRPHTVGLMWIKKRKASQDTDSTNSHNSPKKRVKLADNNERIHNNANATMQMINVQGQQQRQRQ